MAKDLHEFLKNYEREHPEDVIHIEKEINLKQEVTALVMKLEKLRRYPVLVFHKLRTLDGGLSCYPLVTNLFASRTRCARLFNSTFERAAIDFYRLAGQAPREPVIIGPAEAPVKEVVKKKEEADLFEFPALIHHRGDPGQYFTAGYFTCFDPDSGIDNSALHRGWIKDKRELRCYLTPHSHCRYIFDKFAAKKKEMPVAFWVGHHPLACLASQARLGFPQSHFQAMGGLLEEPLRLVSSETLGDDFLVPADAEVVVEGIMKTDRLFPEGPFGEYTGYEGPQIPNPAFEVTAVTHRRDAYWLDILVGHPDNQVMGGFGIEAALYQVVKERVPTLKAVYVPLSGTCRFHAYLQLEKPRRGDAREAIMTALPVDYRLKHVFVFDEDINIFDEQKVLWALATRTQWDEDVMIFPRTRGSELDPSTGEALTTKGGIDCTKPAGEHFAATLSVDEEVYSRIDPAEIIGEERLRHLLPEAM